MDPSAVTSAPSPRSVLGAVRHVPALDGLRGVAVVGVLLFHTGRLTGGFLGVDLFFVLSGYLITGLLLREVSVSRTVALVAFWGRRSRRLLPPLATVLVVVTLAVWGFGSTDVLRTTLSDGPWVQANLLNWHLLAESASYWDAFGHERVFEHLWSLAVEEQFYLLWPLVVLAVARWSRRPEVVVLVVALTGAVVSAVLMAWLVDPSDPTRAYTGTDTRAFALLLGAAAATAPARTTVAGIGTRTRDVGLATLAAALVALWLLVDGVDARWLYTGGLVAHSAGAGLLIAMLAHPARSGVGRLLAMRPLRWVGGLSYSVYLWHWPVVLMLAAAIPRLDGWALTLAVTTISLGAAALSTIAVEDRVRFRAAWARGRSGVVVLLLVMVALAVLWIAIPQPAPVRIDLSTLH